jgi:hypothetical protein
MKLSTSDKFLFTNATTQNLWLLAVISVIALVYFSTLSVNHNEAEDSLFYLLDISRGSIGDQVHPNHLLYNFINYLFLHTWQLFGYEGSVELPVKVINIMGSLCSLLLLYIIATHLKFHFMLRYFCVFAVAFSYGVCLYSVECETYVLPLVFVLLCFRQLMLIQIDFFKPANHLLLGVFNAIAILLHQQHSLLGPVIFVGYLLILYFNKQRITWKIFLLRISLYIFVCFFVTLSSYLIAAVFVKGLTTYSEIVSYALGRFNKTPTPVGYWSMASIPLVMMGLFRTFIGGHFLFSYQAISNFLQEKFPNFMLREEIFLVKDFSIVKSIALSILSITIIFLMTFIFYQIVKQKNIKLIQPDETKFQQQRFTLLIFITYLVIYSLFNIWWEPQNIEYWISVIPVCLLVFGFVLNPLIYNLRIRISTGIITICLFVTNLFGSVLPQTSLENDYWYVFNSWLIKNCNSDDIVVSGSAPVSDAYVRYYSGAKVVSIFPDPDDRPIDIKFNEIIADNKTARILFSSTVYSPPKEYLNKFNSDNSAAKIFFEKSKKHLTLIHTDSWQKIYLYNEDHR